MALSDTTRFLLAFARHPSKIGALAPSSRTLARAMCVGLEVGDDELLLEFGPGTGPFTDQIRHNIPDPACYLGIERDAGFVGLLQKRHPDLSFVTGSAEHAAEFSRHASEKAVGSIISGLPFAILPASVQDGIIDGIVRLLPAGGMFRTFQYVHAYALPSAVRFRRRMAAILGPCQRSRPVLRNMPPAFVLSWQRAGDGSYQADASTTALPGNCDAL